MREGRHSGSTKTRVISESYERLMKISGLKMFAYGRTLPPPAADHTVDEYSAREQARQEERIAAATAALCERYGIEPDSPQLHELAAAHRDMADGIKAAAFARGAAWGMRK